MKISITRLFSYIVYFINFIGFYAIIALLSLLGVIDESRFYTIPIRLLVVVLILILLVKNRYKPCNNKVVYFLFSWFFSFYFFKIILEIITGATDLHMPAYEYMLYSIIYGIIPFIFFSQRKSPADYELIFKAIYMSGVIFSILSLTIFVKTTLIEGNFNRNDSLINPLIYSYSGALLIGICAITLLFDTCSPRKKMILTIGVLFGIIPFLIGGSRGSILALIIPLFYASLKYKKVKLNGKYIVYSILVIIMLFLATTFLGDISFKRLFNIFEDMKSGSVEAFRLTIWRTSFNQFLDSPIWGDSIQTLGGRYPHNLILEVLMATGIIGLIPYGLLLVLGLKRSNNILKFDPANAWMFLFFSLTILMGMLSGNIYSDIWYWSSLSLILSYDMGRLKIENRN